MIPVDNEKDLPEIPDNIKGNLNIKPVKWIDEVLEVALSRRPTPRAEETPVAAGPAAKRGRRRATKEVQAH
jgi:ATP-dependent Lon protease